MVSASPASPSEGTSGSRSPRRLGGDLFLASAIIAAIFAVYAAAQFSRSLLSFPVDRADAAVAEDLVAFHRAGEMALAGDAAATYDPARFRADLADHQKGLLWLNPPHALLILAPAAMLPYGAAKAAWMALGVLSMLAILNFAKVRAPAAAVVALLSPALLLSTILLQLGAFIAVGFAAALALAPKRPLVAGIILAFLTMKPQYGLMAPLFLAATGQWRVIVSAASSTFALVAISVAIFGADSWVSFFNALSSVHAPFSRQVLEGTVTFSQTAAKLGGGEAARAASQTLGALACAVVVWFGARRLARIDAIALTLLASLAAAPSAWIYDWPIVAAGLAFLSARPVWPAPVQAAASLAWLAPLVPIFADTDLSRLASPLALDALFVVAATWLLFAKDEAALRRRVGYAGDDQGKPMTAAPWKSQSAA